MNGTLVGALTIVLGGACGWALNILAEIESPPLFWLLGTASVIIANHFADSIDFRRAASKERKDG